MTGRRRLFQFDPEFLDDGASSYSPGRAVTLEDHSRGVAEYAVKFATGCRLDAELYRTAGLLHDLGKLDPRFQAMLKAASPRTAVNAPLAKSARSPRNKLERDRARLVHTYPSGARHEFLSSAVIAAHTSGDDLHHLIVTHHGFARPFADAVEDEGDPLPFAVSHFGLDLPHPSARQTIAEWNAELPERFWRQVRKHGWWGTAYREAVFRLADHAQSRAEQDRDWTPPPTAAATVTLPAKAARPASFALPLPGLDGANPLAFLAALGTLRLADEMFPGAKLRWSASGRWHPVLELATPMGSDEFVTRLHARLWRVVSPSAADTAAALDKKYRARLKAKQAVVKSVTARKLTGAARDLAVAEEVRPLEVVERLARREWLEALEAAVPAPFLSLGKVIAVGADEFAAFARRSAERLHGLGPRGRSEADFVSAFGCEACVDRHGRVLPTEFQLINGSGHQFFLETFGTLMESVTQEQLHRVLFAAWTFQDVRLSFRWEPQDDRRYASSWADPSSGPGVRTEQGANLLAAHSLPLFPVAPRGGASATTGFHDDEAFAYLTWPIWESPRGVDATRSLMQSGVIHCARPSAAAGRALGIQATFRSRKFEVGKPPNSKLNLSPAFRV